MLVVRKASKSVSIPFQCAMTLVSLYPSLSVDSVATCAAHPSRGLTGWPLAAVDTRTGDTFGTVRRGSHRRRYACTFILD